jgi:hypothetical protein
MRQVQDDATLQLEFSDPSFEYLLTTPRLVYDDMVGREKLLERKGVADRRMAFSDDAG